MIKSMKWYRRMMAIADEVSSWSKDPDHRVGAVITTLDNRIISTGYNGYPKGIDYVPKSRKLFSCVHAEVNALVQAPQDVYDHIMYVTRFPCAQCAAMIIQSGISMVVTRPLETESSWYDSMLAAAELFSNAQVCIRTI